MAIFTLKKSTTVLKIVWIRAQNGQSRLKKFLGRAKIKLETPIKKIDLSFLQQKL